jgi:superfamily II DNA or RNA helicase
MITPLGAYNLGHTDDIIAFCKKSNIKYTIDKKLYDIVHPNMYIENLDILPNPMYIYRDYQETLIKSLANNGRGVIISPTRSGKSLILAGLFHNTLLNTNKNKIQNILLVVPNLLLVEQFCKDLEDYFSVKEETIIVTLANNKKIELDGEDFIETARGTIRAKDLKKSDDIISIPF